MLRFAVVQGCVLGGLAIGAGLAMPVANAAERPPELNLEPTCSITALGVSGRTREACMNSENAARQTLGDKWKDFTARQQQRCTGLVHMGGPPSYVELLTCLEMAEQARQIPDRGVMGGTAGGMGTFKD